MAPTILEELHEAWRRPGYLTLWQKGDDRWWYCTGLLDNTRPPGIDLDGRSYVRVPMHSVETLVNCWDLEFAITWQPSGRPDEWKEDRIICRLVNAFIHPPDISTVEFMQTCLIDGKLRLATAETNDCQVMP